MKFTLEAAPGELEQRLDQVLAAITEMAGGDLRKSEAVETHAVEPLLPLLQEFIDRARQQQVQRIQRIMQRRIAEIIKG